MALWDYTDITWTPYDDEEARYLEHPDEDDEEAWNALHHRIDGTFCRNSDMKPGED